MKRFLGVLLAGAIMGTMPSVAQGAPPLGVTGMAQDGRVELSWQAAAGATSYNVYRGTSPTAINTPVSLTGVPPPPLSAPVSFGDGTAANGTTYYYAVRAVVGGVESANSRVVRATPRRALLLGRQPRGRRRTASLATATGMWRSRPPGWPATPRARASTAASRST